MPKKIIPSFSVSRREFIKGLGTTAISTATARTHELADQLETLNKEQIYGPEAVSIALNINGEAVAIEIEPNVTLLDVLRIHLSYTGAKEACGRGGCGSCTVLFDGVPINACMKLAIEAHGHAITTVEGLAVNGALSTLQQAFIQEDGMMCGYCTSGFLMSLTAFLKNNPEPTEEEVREACSGNICRCGTYPHIFASALRAAGLLTKSQTEVIDWSHDGKLA